jgi:hypothetical protein
VTDDRLACLFVAAAGAAFAGAGAARLREVDRPGYRVTAAGAIAFGLFLLAAGLAGALWATP